MINRYRILASVVLLFALFLAPWMLAAAAAIILAWVFPRYYELIAAGIILDAISGAYEGLLGGLVFTAAALASFFIIEFLKTRIRYYE